MDKVSSVMNWLATIIACLGMSFVATSCAHCSITEKQPPCVSKCGMLLEDKGNGSMSCTHLQEAEDAVLNAFDELKSEDPRLAKDAMCKSIFGWQLHLHEEVAGSDSEINDGSFFVGLSRCGSKEMDLLANQDWRHGAYPHEIVHVAQNCQPPDGWEGTPDGISSGHKGWMDHGVYGMIDEFRRGLR